MAANESFPHVAVPDPKEIVARVFALTGDVGLDLAMPFGPKVQQEASFAIAREHSVATAVVRVIRRAVSGTGEHTIVGESDAAIGHYDPAQQAWMLYPEYIQRHERQSLQVVLEQRARESHAALFQEATTGKQYIDLRHSITHAARQRVAEVLAAPGVAHRLIADYPTTFRGWSRRCDAATTSTCIATTQPNQSLAIAYKGLIVKAPSGEMRTGHVIPIAARFAGGGRAWLPNRELLSAWEWHMLASIPALLARYSRQEPLFSTEHCAVVHNYPV